MDRATYYMPSGKNCLFVDTSGWIEVHGKKRDLHQQAEGILFQAVKKCRPIITTNYVIVEFIGNAQKKCGFYDRKDLFRAYLEIRNLLGIVIIHIDERIHTEELIRLRMQPDKGWSLVDATSFNVMSALKITDALAKDSHFTEAGFNELLAVKLLT
jgi:predicted nucleic acid-binding protein